jgi:hypothetical protein
MKVLGRESLVVGMLAAAFFPINAEDANDVVLENECLPVHETLKELGAGDFSKLLMTRGMDFKYGKFTIFAPSDKLLNSEVLILKDTGYMDETIDDIVLFHVSSMDTHGDIMDPRHCGYSLLMLNEELNENQESSITGCDGGKIYQIGPGNTDIIPEVVGKPIRACDSVIYTIDEALMLPTLPNINLAPTIAPEATKAPSRQTSPTKAPTKAPTEVSKTSPPSGASNALLSSRGTLAFAAFAAVIVSFL